MKDNETKERFIELRAEGRSFERIAKELKTSKQTLIDWSKELELEIANLKAIELEALQERYYLTKKAKIERFGKMLDKLKQEIEKRDFSQIPTDKLVDMIIKLHDHIKGELTEIQFTEETQDLNDTFTLKKTWQP